MPLAAMPTFTAGGPPAYCYLGIHRGKMIKILKVYGVPPNLLRAIENIYTNTKAKVMSPFLFIIVLDFALRNAISGKEEDLGFTIVPRKSRRHPKVALTDLDFADDIALLSDEISQAQELLFRVENQCNRVGLGLNAKKTKYITYNVDNPLPLKQSKETH